MSGDSANSEEADRAGPLPSLSRERDLSKSLRPPAITRRSSTLQRRESIISSYKSELYERKVVTFMKNGDRFFEGIKINVTQKNFRTWDVLLSELSRCIDLPAGVRNIYTPEGGHRVTSMSQFEHQKTYVCASTEPFKRMNYSKAKAPAWQSTTKTKPQSTWEAVLSGSFNSVFSGSTHHDRPVFTKRKESRSKRSMRLISLEYNEQETPQTNAALACPPKSLEPILRMPSPTGRPIQITVIRNGPPPRHSVSLLLNKSSIGSWEEARALISKALDTLNGCLRLFKPNGEEVQSLSQLWRAGNILIAVGSEKFDISEFLMVTVDTTHFPVKAENPKVAKELLLSDEEPADPTNQTVVNAVTENATPRTSTPIEVAPQPSLDDMNTVHTRLKPVRPSSRLETVPSPASSQSQTVHSHAPSDKNQNRNVGTPVAFVSNFPPSPLTSATAIPVDVAIRKFQLANFAYIASQERPFSSGSSTLVETPSSVVLRPFPRISSLIHPETPQSDVSFGTTQSVVNMLLPTKVGSSENDETTLSSGSSSNVVQKTRSVGIQTDYVDDKLSTVFDTNEKPSKRDSAVHKKRRGIHKKSSIASQTDILGISTSMHSSNSRVKEKYQIGITVGEGNYAVVKVCQEKHTHQDFLLKMISKGKIFGQEDLIRNELKILRMLHHENVVQMLDEWETNDEICLVMEQIKGSDLFDAILHCQHFSEPDAVRAMQQLGLALIYLHAHRVVHRDIKPENILLAITGDGSWNIKVGGFGLATVVTEPLSLVCGNPCYNAPEMIQGTGYGTKHDVWSAGVICYILLSGTMPFGRKNKTDVFQNIRSGKYSFPSPFWNAVSEEAKDFVRHLLVVSPQQRYSSSQMLQHPWLQEHSLTDCDSEDGQQLSKTLIEHLNSKRSSRNAVVPIFSVTALDKRKGLIKQHDGRKYGGKYGEKFGNKS